MSQRLILELSDEVYTALQRQANDAGISVAELVAVVINNRQYSLPITSKSYNEEAHQRLLGYAGVISLGYPTGADKNL